MPSPVLLLVNGHPGAGKTRLAEHLGAELGFPLVAKDAIKERLFEVLGVRDRAWSQRLGHAAIEVLFGQVESLLRAGSSVIVDSPLRPEFDDPRIRRLEETYGCRTIQLVLTGDGDTLFARFRQRAGLPERHPGHVEAEVLQEMRERLAAPFDPLDVSGTTVTIDTTDYARVDYRAILGRVRAVIDGAEPAVASPS